MDINSKNRVPLLGGKENEFKRGTGLRLSRLQRIVTSRIQDSPIVGH